MLLDDHVEIVFETSSPGEHSFRKRHDETIIEEAAGHQSFSGSQVAALPTAPSGSGVAHGDINRSCEKTATNYFPTRCVGPEVSRQYNENDMHVGRL